MCIRDSSSSNPEKKTQSFQGQATHARRAYNKPKDFRNDKFGQKKPFSKRYGRPAVYDRSRTADARETQDDEHLRDHTGKRIETQGEKQQRDKEELAHWRKHGKAPPKKEEGHKQNLRIIKPSEDFPDDSRFSRRSNVSAPIKRQGESHSDKVRRLRRAIATKSYGKPLYGVTSLEKEGDGAGNSGVNSLETTGVYNARYSDNHGRYRDQERDTGKKGEEKDDGRRSRD